MESGGQRVEGWSIPDDAVLRRMFDLLRTNMEPISPVDGEPGAVFAGWRDIWLGRMAQEEIHLVREECGGLLCGFLFYSVDRGGSVLSIDELQIAAEHQKDGVTLRKLLMPLLAELEALPCSSVATYANKLNPTSPWLARKLGFEPYGETDRGWRFRIEKTKLIKRLASWRR